MLIATVLFPARGIRVGFGVVAALAFAMPVLAKPTPEPGGAGQASAVAGTLHDASLFNGQVRVRKMKITKVAQSPEESYPDADGQRWLVFRALMSNGTAGPSDIEQFSASIVDADGVSFPAQPDKVRPAGLIANVAPGGAWRENVLFQVPSDFKPVKVVLVAGSPHYKAFRISVAPEDVPAP